MNIIGTAIQDAIKDLVKDAVAQVDAARDEALAAIVTAGGVGRRRRRPLATAPNTTPKEIALLLGISNCELVSRVQHGQLVNVATASKITGLPQNYLQYCNDPHALKNIGCNRRLFPLMRLMEWQVNHCEFREITKSFLLGITDKVEIVANYNTTEFARLLCVSSTTAIGLNANQKSIFYNIGSHLRKGSRRLSYNKSLVAKIIRANS